MRGDQVLLHERLDEEGLHGVQMSHDLFVAAGGVGPDGGEFEAVERALASQSLATIACPSTLASRRVFLADQDGEQRIVAETVVVVEVFVAQAEGEDALFEQLRERVLNQVGMPMIGETGSELVDEVELGFDLSQQEAAGIGGDGTSVEASDNLATAEVLEEQFRVVTVCHGVVVSVVGSKRLLLFSLCQLRNHRASPVVRNSG